MEPFLRISGHGVITITLSGLAAGETDGLRKIVQSSEHGGGIGLPPVAASKIPAKTAESPSPEFVLAGTYAQLKQITRLFAARDGVPSTLSKKIDSVLDNFIRSDYKIDCRGKILDLGSRTHVMGILNVTPDSFSDGGLYADADRAYGHALEMVAAGADIIDIGGESTRPGAQPLSEEEELCRTVPLIGRLAAEIPVPISIDTYKSSVAKKALEAGASIVNDISGLRFSPDMAKVAADYGAAVVVMHIKGTPRNMQQNPVYEDVIGEIFSYLEEGIAIAVDAGVDREKVLIDPGIGFGKALEHNLTILNRLDEFRGLGRPIVLGTSRKKFIGTVLEIPLPEDRAFGTAATVALGIERGASVVRVHDVKGMAQVARLTDSIVKTITSVPQRH